LAFTWGERRCGSEKEKRKEKWAGTTEKRNILLIRPYLTLLGNLAKGKREKLASFGCGKRKGEAHLYLLLLRGRR